MAPVNGDQEILKRCRFIPSWGEFAIRADLFRTHLRVGIDSLLIGGEAVKLQFAGAYHPLTDLGRPFRRLCFIAQFLVVHRGNVDVDVDAVEQWSGDLGDIALNRLPVP